MSWNNLEAVVVNIITKIYHAGGAQLRWVVWIWCGFVFLYILLGRYDSIHKQHNVGQRKKEEKNYFYALHLFGLITVILEYGYLLEQWPVFFPIAGEIMIKVVTTGGFGLLFLGFIFVLLGRLYLNSFWGKDIYSYEERENYKLVKRNVYSKCRHPIYFGQVCMCLGTALVVNNWIVFGLAVLMVFMNVYRAKREDEYLHKWFGNEWEEYQNKVNFFLPIP